MGRARLTEYRMMSTDRRCRAGRVFEALYGLSICAVTTVPCCLVYLSDLNGVTELVAHWMIKESTDDA